MANENVTTEDLARMIQKGFNENTEQHQQIFNRLDKIDIKLENLVYRNDFDELEKRVKIIEEALVIKKQQV